MRWAWSIQKQHCEHREWEKDGANVFYLPDAVLSILSLASSKREYAISFKPPSSPT